MLIGAFGDVKFSNLEKSHVCQFFLEHSVACLYSSTTHIYIQNIIGALVILMNKASITLQQKFIMQQATAYHHFCFPVCKHVCMHKTIPPMHNQMSLLMKQISIMKLLLICRFQPGTTQIHCFRLKASCIVLTGLISLQDKWPRVTMKQRETMVILQQHCLSCGNKSFESKSNPMALGGKYPMGNVLLS